MNQTIATSPKPAKRSYSPKTLKVLFGFCGNKCANPDCSNPIIKPGTEQSDDLVVGQICHIYAVSDNGPRGKPGLTETERNAPDNLILCCPTHHVVVDGQYETYPAALLLEWKSKQERLFRAEFSAQMNSIGYAELEVAAKALLSTSAAGSSDVVVVPPQDKIDKNGLGVGSTMLLQMGAAKSRECADVLIKAAQLDSSFPDRLRNGFTSKYEELKNSGCLGDELFFAMYDWAAGEKSTLPRKAAGLCILSHLFVICDVFEK